MIQDSLITLHDFHKSTQAHLIRTTRRSLDLGKKDLAGRLDDVLLRQRFWEDDIHFDDGALSDLEANDELASSIIRRYLDDISYLLHEIDKILVKPLGYVSFDTPDYISSQGPGTSFRIVLVCQQL